MTKIARSQRLTVLGFVICVLLIGYSMQDIFEDKPSGCPADFENTDQGAQVFLMGTIGGVYSDPNRDCWREYVVQPELDKLGVTYYNPVVEHWSEEKAREEAEAIANAETIVLVITQNHPSFGSLAESGWAVLSAIERNQTIIMFITKEQENEDSLRARKIVLSQANTLNSQIDELIMVNDLNQVVEELHLLYGE